MNGGGGAQRTPAGRAVLRALAGGLARYRVPLGAAAAVLTVLALLPQGGAPPPAAGAGDRPGSGFVTIDPDAEPGRRRAGRGPAGGVPVPPATAEASPPTDPGPDPSRPAATATTAARAASPAPARLPDPPCDARTGRLAVPTRYAPPCVASVAANGGATHPGVTSDTITVAVYLERGDPATRPLLRAAGFYDTDEDVAATYRAYVDYFEHHYQTWGRRVELVFVTPSGPEGDADAARADAARVATEVGAFASWGGPAGTTAYADELAARGVLCLCAPSQPGEYYARRAPYVLSAAMSSTQADAHVAEYTGKRLAGRPARHAGDVLLARETRRFGLLHPPVAGAAGAAPPLARELARYGVTLAEARPVRAAGADPAGAQEQARVTVARLKEAGVTTVLYAGDALSPVFLTQEATRQRYHPEWVLTGAPSIDMAFFARAYDQTQWAHAFGLSHGPVGLPRELGDAWAVHAWHHGAPPRAAASHRAIYEAPFLFYTGMHLGGPVVTPGSIRDGLFRFPATGEGAVTGVHLSFGLTGVWPFEDLTGGDDVTEIWWDTTAAGPDEAGRQGLGRYRYVDGGRRHLPGRHPATEPSVFQRDRSVTAYRARPPSEAPPSYAHSD